MPKNRNNLLVALVEVVVQNLLFYRSEVCQSSPRIHPMDGDQHQQDQRDITSPFSTARATPVKRSAGDRRSRWIVGAIIGVVVVATAVAAVLTLSYLNDPYRKLEEFPVSKYFDSFSSLAGLKFRSNLRVEADLGWKDGVGRLMVFTPNGESRQLAVFIPPSSSGVFFNKGQNYVVELEVKEGGLIYADSCRKD